MELNRYFFVAFIFSLIIGTLLHFTYGWSGKHKGVGYFSAVSESIWEHSKLSAMPLVFFSLIVVILPVEYGNNLFIALPSAMIVAIVTTAMVFYSYTSVLKTCILPVDISIFVLACWLNCKVYTKIIVMNPLPLSWQLAGSILTGLLLLCFAKWSENPPNYPYFTRVSYKRKK